MGVRGRSARLDSAHHLRMKHLLLLPLALLAVYFGTAAAAETNLPRIVDRIFAMKKAQWEASAPRFANPKWKVRLRKSTTGTNVVASDPSTGMGVSIQPFYLDDKHPPAKLVVGSFQALGRLPANAASSEKEVARAAQRAIGGRYSVSARYVKMPPSWEGFELTVTRAAR